MRYQAMPERFRAELIGGIVFMSWSLKQLPTPHQDHIVSWLGRYESATQGTESLRDASVILGKDSEPQPDACLLIAIPGKGQTRNEDSFIVGAPELLAEVATSMAAIDFHLKLNDYERYGMREYLVVALQPPYVLWFEARGGVFQELPLGSDGILRSEAFPGLWLDPQALLGLDGARVLEVLRQGLATPEHAAFVAALTVP